MFEIDSTVYATSDIGQFYSKVDNFVMSEQEAAPRDVKDVTPDLRTSEIRLKLPSELFFAVLEGLSALQPATVQQLCLQEHVDGSGTTAEVTMDANPLYMPRSTTPVPDLMSPRKLAPEGWWD